MANDPENIPLDDPGQSGKPPTGSSRRGRGFRPGTFQTVNLEKLNLHMIDPVPAYAKALYDEVKRVKAMRLAYYQGLRNDYGSVLRVRKWLIILAIVALLATALSAAATIARVQPIGIIDPVTWGLGTALIAYALMSALSFWESASAGSSAYFRSNAIILALRDLWEQYEFDQVAILAKTRAGADPAETKAELLSTARALVAAMDTLGRTELEDWRGEIQASLTQLAAVGKEGLAAIKAELKAEYDRRLARLEAAATPKPKSYVTLQIKGALVGEAEISVDNGRAIRTDKRQVALAELSPGPHQVRVTGKDKDGGALTADEWVDLKAGIAAAAIQVS